VIERVVKMTLREKPPVATHWSARTLAKAVGISHPHCNPALQQEDTEPPPKARIQIGEM
jgi:hypothetical protein